MSRRGRFGYGRNSTDDEAGDDYKLTLVSETDLAWAVSEGEFDSPTIWLPKSACSCVAPAMKSGCMITIWVPDWLAEQKGLA